MRIRSLVLLLPLTFAFPVEPASAQKKKEPPAESAASIALQPQAPAIDPAFPFGATRGTRIELTIAGKKLDSASALWTSFPAKSEILSKSATEVKAALTIPADSPVGFQTLRIVTAQGISNASPFCVDDLPQVIEVATNREKKTPQKLTAPAVAVGRIEEEKSAWYVVAVEKGQRLTFETIGRRLGNPIDPILKLYDGKGREIVGATSDDPPGLQGDARIVHTFAERGECLVEMRDAQFKGGKDYAYRLRIGDFPVGLVVEPLFLQAGKSALAKFPGINPEADPVEIVAPPTAALGSIEARPRGKGQSGWPLPVRLSDQPELMEREPNDAPAQAMELPVPCGVSAGFQKKGDADYYRFAAKKGTKYIVLGEAYDINTPAEVYLRILGADQKVLAKSDPQFPTARAEFKAEADGPLFIKAEHLNFLFGPGEAYHLVLKEEHPDFELGLPLDRCAASAGRGTLIPVTVKRSGYSGEIQIKLAGPAEVTGEAVVPAGATSVLVPVNLGANASSSAYLFAVAGEAVIGGRPVRRYAGRLDAVRKEMAGLLFPPLPMATQCAVGVVPLEPLSGTAALAATALTRDRAADCKVTIRRGEGATGEVAVAVVGLPEGVTAVVKPIPAGASEAVLTLKADGKAVAGRMAFAVKFTAKVGGKDMVFYSPVVEAVIAK